MKPRCALVLLLLFALGARAARTEDIASSGEELDNSEEQIEIAVEVEEGSGDGVEQVSVDKQTGGSGEEQRNTAKQTEKTGKQSNSEKNKEKTVKESTESTEEKKDSVGEQTDSAPRNEDGSETEKVGGEQNDDVGEQREGEGKKKPIPEDKSSLPHGAAPVIETTEGKVRGSVMTSRNGKTIYVYQGIPYAKPPVGDLRFKNPQRAEKWESVRDCTRERSPCAQMKFPTREYIGTEDCLYLNVYTTRLPVNDSVVGKVVWDVVVLIHGGGFTHGTGHFDDYSPEHLLDTDRVLVTFNYRLNVLGFLATDDEASPGNYGLKDQLDALRWVRRNIESFSGNPQSITLLGPHAGGASAHFHLLSPLSHDLFHGVISISGTGLSPWARVPGTEARRRAFKMGELMGCKEKDTMKLVKCLKRKQTEELVKKVPHVTEWLHDMHYPFVPVIEPVIPGKKAFIQKDPEEMIKDLKGKKIYIPWIIGVASHEGLPQALQTMVFRSTLNQLNENPIKNLPLYLEMSIEPQSKAEEIAKRAWDFYLRNETLHYGNLEKLAEITSDYNYFYGVMKSVDLHTQVSESPLFVYHFSFHIRDPRFALGVPQGDDVRYLLPDRIGGQKIEYEGDVFPTIQRLVKIVENFARDGDPTPDKMEELNNLLWPPAQGKSFQYVDIGDKITIKSNGFYPERMAFWDNIDEELRTVKNVKDEL